VKDSAWDSSDTTGEPGPISPMRMQLGPDEPARICARCAPGLSGYFRHYTQAPAIVKELLAETMLTAWNLWPTYNPEEHSTTVWAFTIAQTVLHRRGIEPGPIAPQEAASALSRPEREILALKLGGGLSDDEIAEITGLRQPHVHLILQRALERIGLARPERSGAAAEDQV